MNIISKNLDDGLNKCYVKFKEEKFKTETKINALIFCYFCFFVYTWYISITFLFPLKFNDSYFILHFLFQGVGTILLGLFSDICGRKKCLNISFAALVAIFLIIFLTINPSFFLFYENSRNPKNFFVNNDIHNINNYTQYDTKSFKNIYEFLKSYDQPIKKAKEKENSVEEEKHYYKIFRKNNFDKAKKYILNSNDKSSKYILNNKKMSSHNYIHTNEIEKNIIDNMETNYHLKNDDFFDNTNNKFVNNDYKNNNNNDDDDGNVVKKDNHKNNYINDDNDNYNDVVNKDNNKNNNFHIYDISNDEVIYFSSSDYDNLSKLLENSELEDSHINHKNINYNKKKIIDNVNDKLNNNSYKKIKKIKKENYFNELYNDIKLITAKKLDEKNIHNFKEIFIKKLIKECIKKNINNNFVDMKNNLYEINEDLNIIKNNFNKITDNANKINQKLIYAMKSNLNNVKNICLSEIITIIDKLKKINGKSYKKRLRDIKNEEMFSLTSQVIFYILTFLSVFFVKGINNILCIIITENIRSSYKTRAVFFIFIIDNICLILVRLLFFLNKNYDLYYLYKVNLFLLTILNIIIIIILNISFADLNADILKIQKKALKNLYKKNYHILINHINNNDGNIKWKNSLNNENNLTINTKKKNISYNFKYKNKQFNDNFEEGYFNVLNFFRTNEDDTDESIMCVMNEIYIDNKFNNVENNINLNNNIDKEIYNIEKLNNDNDTNQLSRTNDIDKLIINNNIGKLYKSNNINNSSENFKINYKKKKDIIHDINNENCSNILNFNSIKQKKKDDDLIDKIIKNKEILEYNEFLKKNDIFKIYIKWIYYYFDAHKYLILALCALFFLFNFLYISFFIIYNLFIYDIKKPSNFYKLNNSFIIMNSIILIFFLFLYFKLNRIVLKILNLFGYLLITFMSFGLILFLCSTSYFQFSLYDNTYIIYSVIFYLFLFMPNASLFLFSINSFHTICKGFLLGIFVFCGNLGFITYAIIRFFIILKYFTLVNLIFSCVICILSSIIMILFIPQMSASLDHYVIDNIYFYHFLSYIYNKKGVSPLFRTISTSYGIHNG